MKVSQQVFWVPTTTRSSVYTVHAKYTVARVNFFWKTFGFYFKLVCFFSLFFFIMYMERISASRKSGTVNVGH